MQTQMTRPQTDLLQPARCFLFKNKKTTTFFEKKQYIWVTNNDSIIDKTKKTGKIVFFSKKNMIFCQKNELIS